MKNCNCNQRFDCPVLSIMVSIIVGIVTAILSFTATLTIQPLFVWIVLAITVLFLAILLILNTSCCSIRRCAEDILPTTLFGILITVLAAILLLTISFAATSIIATIIRGVLLGGLSLVLTSVSCIITCTYNNGYED